MARIGGIRALTLLARRLRFFVRDRDRARLTIELQEDAPIALLIELTHSPQHDDERLALLRNEAS
jgi:hypothetical protein